MLMQWLMILVGYLTAWRYRRINHNAHIESKVAAPPIRDRRYRPHNITFYDSEPLQTLPVSEFHLYDALDEP